MSYRTKYNRLMIRVCAIMLSVAFVLPNTTELVEAHSGPDHEFPTFEQEFDVFLFGEQLTIILGCVGYFPLEDANHHWPWIWPHKFCAPPGIGIEGPDDEGCFSITFCGLLYECYGRVCPPDDDDDDDTGGNNDDTGGNNIDTGGNNDDTSGNNDDTSGNNDDTSGNNDDTSGNNDDTSGNNDDTSGNNG